MSNTIEYDLEVLASSPEEMAEISERVVQPSTELVKWAAGKFDAAEEIDVVTETLREVVAFRTIVKLGYVDDSLNQARRFDTSCRSWCTEIVETHILEVSAEFPATIFLLAYRDQGFSYSGKLVIHGGHVVRKLHDGHQKTQALDWALVDIFAPFRAEYYGGHELGSLWVEWLDDIKTAIECLRSA